MLKLLAAVAVNALSADIKGNVLFGRFCDTTDLLDHTWRWSASCKAAVKGNFILLSDLEDSSELFVEQCFQYVLGLARRGDAIEHDLNTASSGKGHFSEGCEETTVRPVVVGEDDSRVMELFDSVKVVLDDIGIVDIRRFVANLPECLRQSRAAHVLLARC